MWGLGKLIGRETPIRDVNLHYVPFILILIALVENSALSTCTLLILGGPSDSAANEQCERGLPSLRGADGSAGHVENGICSFGLVGKCLDSFVRGQNQQLDFSAARLEFHLVHHRKRSISSRADYEALALPGYLSAPRADANLHDPKSENVLIISIGHFTADSESPEVLPGGFLSNPATSRRVSR
jgi:hypothetical protein